MPRPGELVRVFSSAKDVPNGEVPYPDYLDFRSNNKSLAGLIAYDPAGLALSRNRNELAQFVGGWMVSANFFSVLEVVPALGRAFRDEEDRPGAAPVVVIGHDLWQRHFDSDPAIIGRHVQLSGNDFTIVGVAPERFAGTELYFHPELFVPLSMMHFALSGYPPNAFEDRASRWLTVVGRLKQDVHAAEANAEFLTLSRQLEQSYPDTNRGRTAVVLPEMTARARLDDGGARGAAVMLALAGLVLLLSCANVANLLLARAAGRTREMALRLSIGAGRTRLVRQLLIENTALALAAACLGVAIAQAATAYVSQLIRLPSDLPLSVDLRIDDRVLLFTMTIGVLTSLLVGVVPARRGSHVDLSSSLKATPPAVGGRRRLTLRNALVASQVALSVIVLVVAGVSVRAFQQALGTDPGFRTDRVLLMSFNPGLLGYDEARTRRFYDDVLGQTAALPGVSAVGLSQFLPLGVTTGNASVVVDGYDMAPGQDRLSVNANTVDPGYWRTLRTPVVRGRAFDEGDTASSALVVIVNETMAKQFWPNQDALGKRVRLRDRSGPAAEVIGIARDGKYVYLAEPPRASMFFPFSQRYRSSMTMTVLAQGDPAALTGAVRAQIASIDASVPVFDVRTLQELYQARALLSTRLTSQLMTAFALLGLGVAIVGLYGVVAYVTARRTQEIGIRIAVGARPGAVVLLVLTQAGLVVGAGLTLGLVAAAAFVPMLPDASFDFMNTRDGVVYAVAPMLVGGVAFLACLGPALRASRIQPTAALRAE